MTESPDLQHSAWESPISLAFFLIGAFQQEQIKRGFINQK